MTEQKSSVLEKYLSPDGLRLIRKLDEHGLGSHHDVLKDLSNIVPRPDGMEDFLIKVFESVDHKVMIMVGHKHNFAIVDQGNPTQ